MEPSKITLIYLHITTGLPDFSWYNIAKRGKYTKWLQNIPNGQKIYEIAKKFSKCKWNKHTNI
jgi:hypothetical protein